MYIFQRLQPARYEVSNSNSNDSLSSINSNKPSLQLSVGSSARFGAERYGVVQCGGGAMVRYNTVRGAAQNPARCAQGAGGVLSIRRMNKRRFGALLIVRIQYLSELIATP